MKMPYLLKETQEFNRQLYAINPEKLHGKTALEDVVS